MATRLVALGTIIIATLLLTACGGSSAIVGTWKVDTAALEAEIAAMPEEEQAMAQMAMGMMGDMTVEFTSDNKVKLSIMGTEQEGTYSVSGSTLTVTMPDQEAQSGEFSVSGNTLTMKGPDGENMQLLRQ